MSLLFPEEGVQKKDDVRVDEASLIRSIVRESFLEFVREFWPVIVSDPLVENWHIPFICSELQTLAERVFRGEPKAYDLVVNIPPGSSKSTLCSQLFPAWVWTRMPHARFICASYAYTISLKDAMKMRDVVESETYRACFPGLELREDQNTKGYFVNRSKGERFSTGVGGAVTGNHAHFILIDDPINPEEAFSDAELATANRWMESTISTRKVDKRVTPMLLIQQRLHQNDPSGELLDKAAGTGSVRHICLPGEYTGESKEPDEPPEVSPPELAVNYVDGLFDPVRLPRPALDQLRRDLGEYGYASQILQVPIPTGGGLFDVNKLIMENHRPGKFVRLVRSWDKAASDSTTKNANWSVGALMGVDARGDYWILDVIRAQLRPTPREHLIRSTAEMDGEHVEVILEIESGSGGKESGEGTVRNLAGFRIHTFHPTGDKESRAYAFASQVGGGTVHCLDRPWTKELKSEMRFFPKSKFDDQIDALSGAFNVLARRSRKVGGWRRKPAGTTR